MLKRPLISAAVLSAALAVVAVSSSRPAEARRRAASVNIQKRSISPTHVQSFGGNVTVKVRVTGAAVTSVAVAASVPGTNTYGATSALSPATGNDYQGTVSVPGNTKHSTQVSKIRVTVQFAGGTKSQVIGTVKVSKASSDDSSPPPPPPI